MMKRPEQASGAEYTSSLRVSDKHNSGPKRKKRKTHSARDERDQSDMPAANPARLSSSTGTRAVSQHVSGSSLASRESSETTSQNGNSRISTNGSGSDGQQEKKPSGIILKSGRVRLPDKLMEFLVKEVVPDVLYWQPDGTSFSFDTKTAQEKLLDRYFSGTKLSSFTRSLNRWGFKRVFHALSPKDVLSYEHPSFTKADPENVKNMKMAVANEGNNATANHNNKCKTPPPVAAPSCTTAGHQPPSFVSVPHSAYMPVPVAAAPAVPLGSPISAANTAHVDALKLMADAASSLQKAPSSVASHGSPPQSFLPSQQINAHSSPTLSSTAAPGLPSNGSALLRTLALTQSTSSSIGGQDNQIHALQTLILNQLQNQHTTAAAPIQQQQQQQQPPMDLTALLQAAFASGQASALAQQQAQAVAPPTAPPAPTGQTLATLLRQQPSLLQRQDIQAFLMQSHQPQQQQPALAAALSAQTTGFPSSLTSSFSAPAPQHNDQPNQSVMRLVLGLLNNQNQRGN